MAKKLGESLVDAGLMTNEQLQSALKYQEEIGGALGRIIVKLSMVDDKLLTQFLAEQQALEVVSLKDFVPDKKLQELVPQALAEEHLIVPVRKEGNRLIVAVPDAADCDAIDDIRFRTGLEVEAVLAVTSEAQAVINRYYHGSDGDDKKPRARKHMLGRAGVEKLAKEIKPGIGMNDLLREISDLGLAPASMAKVLAAVLVEKKLISIQDLRRAIDRIAAAKQDRSSG